jgi:hypothetical protein
VLLVDSVELLLLALLLDVELGLGDSLLVVQLLFCLLSLRSQLILQLIVLLL